MAIKKVGRRASRKAVSTAKRAGKTGRAKVSRKSGKKVKRSTIRRGKKRTSRKKRVSKKSRVTRKRRRSTRKATASRKRRATKKSPKKGKKQAAKSLVEKEQAEKVNEKKAPAAESVAETVSTDLGSISLGSYEVELTEAGPVAIPRKEVAETPTDSVSGYDLPVAESEQPVENDEQTPDEENVTESPSAEGEPESCQQSAEPESVAQSAEPESAPENDYVVIDKEDAESFREEAAVEEEESVPVEEPVHVNDNQRDAVQEQEAYKPRYAFY